MLRYTTLSLLVLGAYLGIGSPLQAQYLTPLGQPLRSPYATRGGITGPFGRPALSPYLNLLRGGNSAVDVAANYFAGVVPEQNARNNFAAIQSSLNTLDREVAGLLTEPRIQSEDYYIDTLPGTGHRTYYGNPNSRVAQSTPAVRPTLLPSRSR